MAKAQAGHVLLLTGSAPYLGGPSTWKPLRDAASDLEFRDLDLLDIPPGSGSTAAIKQAIKAAAEGTSAIVAHGAVAATVLGAIDDFRHSSWSGLDFVDTKFTQPESSRTARG